MSITNETLRTWVRDAEQAARPGAVEATAMEEENRQLRARVKALEFELGVGLRGGRAVRRPRAGPASGGW
ncbi:transposase [Streptomyces xanthophaeus]|uniref:transposase n=1 Tax=Streptomyces xanthophaeus TaxID=67385 RepID=UPI00386D1C83|nr:transposase [Streptomyces xanthophaeus]WST59250.1 transposase [Streptomyces xanthophaeus]